MSNRALAGIALVVLGVVLLLSNLGLGVRFNMSSVWPLLVAMVGVMFLRDALQSGGDRSHVFVGVIILGIGALFFFRGIGLITVGMNRLWPAFPIIVGLAFFAQAAALHEPHFSGTGAILCAIGAVFLVINLRLVDTKIFGELLKYWPVLIIAAGVLKLLDSYRR